MRKLHYGNPTLVTHGQPPPNSQNFCKCSSIQKYDLLLIYTEARTAVINQASNVLGVVTSYKERKKHNSE